MMPVARGGAVTAPAFPPPLCKHVLAAVAMLAGRCSCVMMGAGRPRVLRVTMMLSRRVAPTFRLASRRTPWTACGVCSMHSDDAWAALQGGLSHHAVAVRGARTCARMRVRTAKAPSLAGTKDSCKMVGCCFAVTRVMWHGVTSGYSHPHLRGHDHATRSAPSARGSLSLNKLDHGVQFKP